MVVKEDGLLTEVDVIVTVLLECVVGKFDVLDDLVTVGLEGETTEEVDTEVSEVGDLEEGEWG